MKPKRNWADLYVMFQDRRNHRWTNNSPGPHPCGCQVLEEMEIDLEDKWWLEEDHSLSPSEKGEEANSLPGKSCTKRVRPLPFKKGR
ncbi:hypothetical protein IEQ34_023180 [Dendrobium chrysotoxum]|uniref:Uncharacterized protein n=1 Tax=Dendrobium chrysotoxum TaxID=161865 RepID=A0AAV7FPB6_DENCH|nr:hypothetical protein IEQ34_026044 [Dendrobium chrysotoxum]KAH0438886.1 hypothetical protein IEQ34_025997 [Dendrobium chrysotoxum]KAH0440292.1 hypothetical protein IEQ34_025661 [Dendrobium chrysotoxum]KAH0440390.1 hypothetical protein IEQ34_025632 [Dendrobium chrysotoxum]KAH0446079.1 hypothetical protein IEQ34_025087 [Dendrobium chrysotoxum]